MVYRVSKRNIRKPRRRRQSVRRRAPVRRRRAPAIRRRQMNKSVQCDSGQLSLAAKFALAQLDPFEPKCLGAKVPDSNTMPSIANADTDQVNLAPPSVAGNLIGIAFQPAYKASILSATDAASAVSWTNSWATRRNYTNLVAQVEAIRPVAHAIRISSPLAPTSATGFVHVGLSVESRKNGVTAGGAVPDLPRTVNDMTGLAYYKRFTLASLTQSPVTAINKWIDDSGFRYDDPRVDNTYVGESVGNAIGSVTFQFGNSWGTLVVLVDGQTSTSASPLSFEHVLLTECIPRKDAFILGTQAAPNSPGTMSAVSSMLTETDFSHTEAQQESYIQSGVDEIARGARVAGTQVYNNIAVPLLNRVGQHAVQTATNMAINAAFGMAGISGVNSNQDRLALT